MNSKFNNFIRIIFFKYVSKSFITTSANIKKKKRKIFQKLHKSFENNPLKTGFFQPKMAELKFLYNLSQIKIKWDKKKGIIYINFINKHIYFVYFFNNPLRFRTYNNKNKISAGSRLVNLKLRMTYKLLLS